MHKCTMCKQTLGEDETLNAHIRHHIWDPQYGVKQDALVELLIHMMERIDAKTP